MLVERKAVAWAGESCSERTGETTSMALLVDLPLWVGASWRRLFLGLRGEAETVTRGVRCCRVLNPGGIATTVLGVFGRTSVVGYKVWLVGC